ncbi:MAG: translation initiation factor IF-2 subunit gamma [Methanocalculus sp. MSAO_Arc1]|uniref:translation initiation factor IF-2 subunit gamma n=1 Tax=Methanocalculus TaxID=71151 RepID=UPI000FEFFB96|nr:MULTISPECIES: translation initiation factor IF-2 subunit gamma [unclassified Methanocalculus]MCP1662634.1 translation initiation factor 2 subunit 3 [Methanocalculus sp. AMF5]RQD80332.1 MAG: translation initiation factor IF-2 subunit gamma [Methanocalculus sp. MSAO_Arc1]
MHDPTIPSVNIGVVGHVDHGKTTLVSGVTGTWTDRHSEELKRGISIRLGYADVTFYRCPSCTGSDALSTFPDCPVCNGKTEPFRSVSFVDAPGHETLMATMLSGSAIMDGAMLVIAANEPCPQPQTKEHLMALELTGITRIVIVQNKIDVVTQAAALENYKQIKKFVKGTVAENAPIIPVSAQKGINFPALVGALDETIPEIDRDPDVPPVLLIARSFDINKPAASWRDIRGGVIGGSLIRGLLRDGEEIEIRPGRQQIIENKTKWEPIQTKISSMHMGAKKITLATPGGLTGLGTKLDPAITKSDTLVGQVAGHPGKLPPVWDTMKFDVTLMERVVGATSEQLIEPLKHKEPLMLSVGTAVTVGVVTGTRKNIVDVVLKRPVCAEIGSRIAISRQVGGRWRLIGMGVLTE